MTVQASRFKFKEQELAILKNFATINSSMIIYPDCMKIVNGSRSCIGIYNYKEKYKYEQFGIYNMPEFLSVISTLKDPSIDVNEKFIIISDEQSKFRYSTTVQDMIPKVPGVKFPEQETKLEFTLPAEKINLLFKAASIIRADYIFFESDGKKIRLTAANELVSSNNQFDVTIETDIKTNSLESPVKIPFSEFKLFNSSAYEVKLTPKISMWKSSDADLVYYIGVSKI